MDVIKRVEWRLTLYKRLLLKLLGSVHLRGRDTFITQWGVIKFVIDSKGCFKLWWLLLNQLLTIVGFILIVIIVMSFLMPVLVEDFDFLMTDKWLLELRVTALSLWVKKHELVLI